MLALVVNIRIVFIGFVCVTFVYVVVWGFCVCPSVRLSGGVCLYVLLRVRVRARGSRPRTATTPTRLPHANRHHAHVAPAREPPPRQRGSCPITRLPPNKFHEPRCRRCLFFATRVSGLATCFRCESPSGHDAGGRVPPLANCCSCACIRSQPLKLQKY